MQSGRRLAAKYQPCIFCILRATSRPISPSASFPTPRKQRLATQASPRTVQAPLQSEEAEYLRDVQARYGQVPSHGSDKHYRPYDAATRSKRTKARIEQMLRSRLDDLSIRMASDPIVSNIDIPPSSLTKGFDDFKSRMLRLVIDGQSVDQLPPWLADFGSRVQRIGIHKIRDDDLRDNFVAHAILSRFTEAEIEHQRSIADMSYPPEWYPSTRAIRRQFHLHIGPTNSGKTYHALKRLQESDSGYYGGPLRLLAHEVYMRLNAQGSRCNLVTGDDRRAADDDPVANHTSCTVEMLPLNRIVDVAVIDEIQMIADPDRGFAWTQAVLGVQAREVHLCGEERTLPIVKELVALCGDELVVHQYERLSPLEMMPQSLQGDLSQLAKGDCVVCFQVSTIHALRETIEKTLGVKCAVIYGSLPPETRAQQAALFNDPSNNYDILIASDAVGMGLNLSIRRMIFHSTMKFSNATQRHASLKIQEIKQVAGRAGRFSTAQSDINDANTQKSPQNSEASSLDAVVANPESSPVTPTPPPKQIGYVGCFEPSDYELLRSGLESNAPAIQAAGIWPPSYLIARFSTLFPLGTPFSFLLKWMNEIAKKPSRFFICSEEAGVLAAEAIEPVQGLSIYEKAIFSTAPVNTRFREQAALLREYAQCVADGKTPTILDINNLDLNLLAKDHKPSHPYLKNIEALHKGIVLHVWLAYRFPTVFIRNDIAIHVRGLCEKRIEETLAALSFDLTSLNTRRRKAIQLQLQADLERMAAAAGDPAETRNNEPLPDDDAPALLQWKRGPKNANHELRWQLRALNGESGVRPQYPASEAAGESKQRRGTVGQGPRIQYWKGPAK